MKPIRRSPRTKASASPSLLERINPNAAGIDCGADTHYVAVAPDRDAMPVRAFRAFTAFHASYHSLAARASAIASG